MKRYQFLTFVVACFLAAMTSCTNDLNTIPLNTRVQTAASIYDDPTAYKEFLAKLYGSMTLTGQRGQYGQPEISASDEGTTSYLRMLFYAQELTTDEVVPEWGDGGLTEYHGQSFSAQNTYVTLLYQRIFINIAYCNEYIREVSPRVDGLSSDMKASVTQYIAEARFLRAMFYYQALDVWGNVPFVTEKDAPGNYLPPQISRADLFNYVESELKAIIPTLADPAANEYARADKAAAYALLARLYLNSQVYNGTNHYTDCITYLNLIINSGQYALVPKYATLFMADNNLLRKEIIMPVAEDGLNTQDYGGTTYIIHAEVGAGMVGSDYGIGSGGWAGNRPSGQFVNKFADKTGSTDQRAMFFTAGQTLDITTPTDPKEGYLVTKWTNVTSTGALGQNDTFVDTDFPIFRLADVYLMYAEAVLRGGSGGDVGTALGYVNQIRTRAYGGSTTGNITSTDLTLQFILDERARELYWETVRRTDLIRFGQFTGDAYLWDFKGNTKNGIATDSHYNLFPLPLTDLAINTNLKQNPGY